MKISEKDVGRDIVDEDAILWKIIAYVNGESHPVVLRRGNQLRMFSDFGTSLHYGMARLIRFADEPESKPPPETIVIFYHRDYGAHCFSTIDRSARPDLAGQTFTYRLEKK